MRSTFSSASLILLVLGCGEPEPPAPQQPRSEAQKLLAEAGFPGGKGFPKLRLLYNTSEHHKKIAAAVQEMWRRQLGVEVELENLEWKVYLERMKRGEFDIARAAWIGEYLDPLAFLELFRRDAGSNRTGWSSDAYEKLIDESHGSKDRYATLARAERILLDEVPIAPISHYVAHNWIKPFVKGVHANARDLHALQGVTVEGRESLSFFAGEEPGSLDPALSHDIGGLKILMHLFEGLCAYDPKDASPVPAAAERWDVSEDGRTVTFHLRPAQWSNGDPLTAHDFVYAWRRVVDPKTASSYAHRMFGVKGARAVALQGTAPETLGVRAADDRTFVVELDHAAPWFPMLVCLNIFMPVHRATVEKHGEKWTRPENMVHNGPYRMTSWETLKRKTFEKNPRYRDAANVKLARFVFVTVGPDSSVAQRMYDAGQVDWTWVMPTEFMDELRKTPDYLGGPYNGVYYYAFNTRRKPLDDVRVRRALSLAINREHIVKNILRGGETAAVRLTPPLYPGYEVK